MVLVKWNSAFHIYFYKSFVKEVNKGFDKCIIFDVSGVKVFIIQFHKMSHIYTGNKGWRVF